MKNMKKILVLALAALLLVAVSVAGTVAYLTATTDPVINTFTKSNVDITLTETTGETYKMVPSVDITKNPRVTVKAGSEACFVFVKITEAGEVSYNEGTTTVTKKFDDFLTYAIDAGWTVLDGQGTITDTANDTYVIYKTQAATESDTVLQILANDKVSVKDSVNKAMMDALNQQNYPTLTFQAWAIQQADGADTFTPEGAWDKLNPPTTP